MRDLLWLLLLWLLFLMLLPPLHINLHTQLLLQHQQLSNTASHNSHIERVCCGNLLQLYNFALQKLPSRLQQLLSHSNRLLRFEPALPQALPLRPLSRAHCMPAPASAQSRFPAAIGRCLFLAPPTGCPRLPARPHGSAGSPPAYPAAAAMRPQQRAPAATLQLAEVLQQRWACSNHTNPPR